MLSATFFPEGGITRDGEIQRFRSGIERIIERRPVPVIPIALCGIWGSWFSRQSGGGLRKIPGRLWAKVTVRIGEAVAGKDVTAEGMELLVRTLREDTDDVACGKLLVDLFESIL